MNLSATTKRPFSVLPAVLGVTAMCPSFGHTSFVVCKRCHMETIEEGNEKIASLESRNRLLRGTVLYLTAGFLLASSVLVFAIIYGVLSS